MILEQACHQTSKDTLACFDFWILLVWYKLFHRMSAWAPKQFCPGWSVQSSYRYSNPSSTRMGRDDGLWKLKKQDLWFSMVYTSAHAPKLLQLWYLLWQCIVHEQQHPACVSFVLDKHSRTKWLQTWTNYRDTHADIWVDHYTTTVPFLSPVQVTGRMYECRGISPQAPNCHNYDRM